MKAAARLNESRASRSGVTNQILKGAIRLFRADLA
jgi:hypothetical protein